MTRILLGSHQPMVMGWGKEQACLWNDACAALLGLAPPLPPGTPAARFWGQNWDRVAPLAQEVLATGEPVTDRHRLMSIEAEGHPASRFLTLSYSMLTNDDLLPFGILCTITDEAEVAAEQRRQDERMHFIMRELAHRSKNLLAIILSMAGQTARSATSVPDFTTRFTQRLQGLSHSHDLLLQRDWRGVTMRELAERQLQNFVAEGVNRASYSGPDVMVDPKAAQNIGLALHELATNASKHGALSTPDGRVTISWALTDGRFQLGWNESGGPPVNPPEVRGFGQVVLERLASDALEGEVKLDYAPDGLNWLLDIPRSYLVDGH